MEKLQQTGHFSSMPFFTPDGATYIVLRYLVPALCLPMKTLQLLIDCHGVEGAAEAVVGPAHVEEVRAFVGFALPLARGDHIRASVHHLQCHQLTNM